MFLFIRKEEGRVGQKKKERRKEKKLYRKKYNLFRDNILTSNLVLFYTFLPST